MEEQSQRTSEQAEPDTTTTRKTRTWVVILSASATLLLLLLLSSFRSWSHQKPSPEPQSPYLVAYESVLIGVAFGVISMVAALTIVVPAIMVAVITVVVLLAFAGKSERCLVAEGRKMVAELAGYMGRALLKEGNAVAMVCGVLGYLALAKWNHSPVIV